MLQTPTLTLTLEVFLTLSETKPTSQFIDAQTIKQQKTLSEIAEILAV
jgi:hypothetical protein